MTDRATLKFATICYSLTFEKTPVQRRIFMLTGLFCALGAGLMWGLVFISPLMLPEYPGLVQSFGRYTAFGLIVLLPALLDRRRLAMLTRHDWSMAVRLSAVGNLLYYAMLAGAIQLADAPLPVMLIGTLPIVISVYSNWDPAHPSESVAWRKLAPSLAFIFAGLMLVNASELSHLDGHRTIGQYLLGCLLALGAVPAWTWYPVMNARHMRDNPHLHSTTWSTAQGLVTLPMALAGFALYAAWNGMAGGSYDFPLGPRPWAYIGLMLAMGLCASWIGTLLWNRACQLLPTSLAGQLMVFETLAALLYAFLWRGSLPALPVIAGAVLLCAGVLLGVRLFRSTMPT
jgi:drug/metabolite transporter (DMT)-like permease